MTKPLTPAQLGPRLAEVYAVLGPLYRAVARQVELDEERMGMSVGVRAVLDELNRDSSLTVPAIARRLSLSRQFVQRMVNDALQAGWVTRHPNPTHQRSHLLALTPAGEAAIRAVLAREHALMGQVGGELTEQEVRTTIRVLGEMLRAVERLGGQG